MIKNAPRRVPRKMKKKYYSKVSLDFSTEEWSRVRAFAKAEGMRPTQYINQALYNAAGDWNNNESI